MMIKDEPRRVQTYLAMLNDSAFLCRIYLNQPYADEIKLMLIWIVAPLLLFLIAGILLGSILSWLLINRRLRKLNRENRQEALLYKELFQGASDSIMLTDFSGKIKKVNQSFCTLLGYSESELLNKHISVLVDPDHLKKEPLKYTLLHKGEHIFNERPMLRKDGSIVWVNASVKKFTKDTILAIARDITDKKRIEAELQESEAKFKDLAEKSRVGFYIIQDGRFQYVNLRFAEMFGYRPIELVNTLQVEKLIAKEDRDISMDHIRSRLAGEKESAHYETRGCRKDGSNIFIEIFGSMTQYQGRPAIIGSMLDVTDKKLADELVLKEKNFSEAIISTLPGIFLVRNMEGKFLKWNKNFESLTGFSEQEILQSEPYSFIVPHDRERVRSAVQAVQQDGSVSNIETELIKKDGSTVPVFFTGTSFNWEGQVCVMATAFDISRRRQAEEELRKSETKYKLLFNSNPLAMFMISRSDQSIIAANHAAICLYGYSETELLSMTIKDLISEEDRDELAANFNIDAGESGDMGIWRHHKKDGSIVFTQVIAHDINLGGQDVRLALTLDMTQKLKDEEEIHKSRTSLHSILNTTDVAFALFNQDFETVTFNQRAADFASRELKVTLSEGLPLSEYVPLDKANLWGKIAPELILGRHFEFERSYEQAPGKFHWYQIKLLSVTESGVFLGLVASIYDITDRKEDEMHREKITGDLLQRNQDLEQFTYIVSHNLRAPVANIMGICSILKNDNLQHDARLNLEKILTVSVTQLDTVIRDLNQILQVSREISEKNELVIFGEIVENIKSSIPSLIEKEEVQIITDFSEAEGFTTLKTYIYSIFYNLIMNSIKFRKFGQSPVIKISSGQEGQNIILKVEDNGMGIDLQKHGHEIFGLYNRFNPEIPGKGMGLFMVKTQVEMLGGDIQVQSKPDEGTEFIIELPQTAVSHQI